MSEDFVIYRPPPAAHRLENRHSAEKPGIWRPSHSYKLALADVQNQYTPAENFRQRLATSGKQIRLIQRLELRVNRNVQGFNLAAVRVQARARGIIGRRRFAQVKDELMKSLELRRITQHAQEAFKAHEFKQAIAFCRQAKARTVASLLMEAKCHYQEGDFVEVIECSNMIKGMDSQVEELYYIQACAWCRLGKGDAAIKILDEAYVSVPETTSQFVRLYGYICSTLSPPRLESAIDSFSEVIKRHPKDLDALLERASCYCGLQDYSMAVKDLNKVLAFKPDHHESRLRRARMYTCIRDWKAAAIDYKLLLSSPLADQAAECLRNIEPADNNALAHR